MVSSHDTINVHAEGAVSVLLTKYQSLLLTVSNNGKEKAQNGTNDKPCWHDLQRLSPLISECMSHQSLDINLTTELLKGLNAKKGVWSHRDYVWGP